MTRRSLLVIASSLGIAMLVVGRPAIAAEKLLRGIPSAQQWTDELDPGTTSSGTTRAISPSHTSDAVTGTRHSPAKTMSAPPSAATSAPAASAPIFFAYNSAELTDTAKQQLDELAKALQSDRLKSFVFRVEGHTDAVGGEEYNQALSERRAAAVVSYLVHERGIDPTRLVAVGKGQRDLFDPRNPTAAENRRVRIVNLGQ